MILVILGIVAAGLGIIARWDEPLPLGAGMCGVIILGAFAEGVIIRCLVSGGMGGDLLMLSVAGGCLLLASVTDIAICQVYNFVWWPVWAAAVPFLSEMPGTAVCALALFVLLQFVVFGPLYGRADCYGFCACAAAGASSGMGLWGFLTQMFLAWLLLLTVQVWRGNVDKGGNLKRPVPFLPYINVSFWLALAFREL
mgnify:CR=1 FL=1